MQSAYGYRACRDTLRPLSTPKYLDLHLPFIQVAIPCITVKRCAQPCHANALLTFTPGCVFFLILILFLRVAQILPTAQPDLFLEELSPYPTSLAELPCPAGCCSPLSFSAASVSPIQELQHVPAPGLLFNTARIVPAATVSPTRDTQLPEVRLPPKLRLSSVPDEAQPQQCRGLGAGHITHPCETTSACGIRQQHVNAAFSALGSTLGSRHFSSRREFY